MALPLVAGGAWGASKLFGGNPDYVGQDTSFPQMAPNQSILGADNQLLDPYRLKGNADLAFTSYMPQEETNLNGIQLNKMPLQELEGYASGHGDSPWATAQLQALDQSQGQAMGGAKDSARAAATAAGDAAAAHGGLSSGASENLARNAGNNMTLAGQDIFGKGLAQRGAIRSTDEGNRLNALMQLPGMEVNALQPEIQKQSLWQQAAAGNQSNEQALNEFNQNYKTGIDKYNLDSTKQGMDSLNKYNMAKWEGDVKMRAGDENARAMQDRGKK